MHTTPGEWCSRSPDTILIFHSTRGFPRIQQVRVFSQIYQICYLLGFNENENLTDPLMPVHGHIWRTVSPLHRGHGSMADKEVVHRLVQESQMLSICCCCCPVLMPSLLLPLLPPCCCPYCPLLLPLLPPCCCPYCPPCPLLLPLLPLLLLLLLSLLLQLPAAADVVAAPAPAPAAAACWQVATSAAAPAAVLLLPLLLLLLLQAYGRFRAFLSFNPSVPAASRV